MLKVLEATGKTTSLLFLTIFFIIFWAGRRTGCHGLSVIAVSPAAGFARQCVGFLRQPPPSCKNQAAGFHGLPLPSSKGTPAEPAAGKHSSYPLYGPKNHFPCLAYQVNLYFSPVKNHFAIKTKCKIFFFRGNRFAFP